MRKLPPPAIAPLCDCGAVMNGIHVKDCPNRPETASEASIRSRKKARASGFVRVDVLLSPALNAKLDRLAEIHGSRNKAVRAAIAAL
jgi:hypothetical protein